MTSPFTLGFFFFPFFFGVRFCRLALRFREREKKQTSDLTRRQQRACGYKYNSRLPKSVKENKERERERGKTHFCGVRAVSPVQPVAARETGHTATPLLLFPFAPSPSILTLLFLPWCVVIAAELLVTRALHRPCCSLSQSSPALSTTSSLSPFHLSLSLALFPSFIFGLAPSSTANRIILSAIFVNCSIRRRVQVL